MTTLENFLRKNSSTIQTLGIIAAIITLVFTCNNTQHTKKSIELASEKHEEKITPVWKISVNSTNSIDNETLKIISLNSSIVLNSADIYYVKNQKLDSLKIYKKNDYKLYLFKNELVEDINKFYDGNDFILSFYSCTPLLLKFSYYQHGKSKKKFALYKGNFKIYLTNRKIKLSFKSFEFLKYIESFDKDEVIDELESFNYKYCYKNCCQDYYINKKKIDKIKNHKYLNEIYSLYTMLTKYNEYSIVYNGNDNKKEFYVYPAFIADDSLFNEVNLIRKKIHKNRNHFKEPLLEGFLQLDYFIDTSYFPTKSNIESIVKSNWHNKRKSQLIKYRDSMKDSLLKAVNVK